MVHKGTYLAPSMRVIDVSVSLGFRDDQLEAGGGAPGDDIGTVATDERGDRITGSVKEVCRNEYFRMPLLYGLRGGGD